MAKFLPGSVLRFDDARLAVVVAKLESDDLLLMPFFSCESDSVQEAIGKNEACTLQRKHFILESTRIGALTDNEAVVSFTMWRVYEIQHPEILAAQKWSKTVSSGGIKFLKNTLIKYWERVGFFKSSSNIALHNTLFFNRYTVPETRSEHLPAILSFKER